MRALIALGFSAALFTAHDMFLRVDTHFLAPQAEVSVALYNGTFEASENTIARERMADVSLVAAGARAQLDTAAWRDEGETSVVDFATAAPGTYVLGVSTRARDFEMAAADFNAYLEHDGVLDILASRRENGLLGEDAAERYSKHVKAIFQVGDTRTRDWQTKLGYPIEFTPLSNPYDARPGDELRVLLERDGRPLTNHLVYASATAAPHSHEHSQDHEHEGGEAHNHDHAGGEGRDHGAADGHTHGGTLQLRTNAEGVVSVPLDGEGIHYLRTIHLVNSDEPELTHESNWATLTFEVGHAHEDGPTHAHADGNHHHNGGLPGYVWWLGSLALVGGLFLYFRRSRS